MTSHGEHAARWMYRGLWRVLVEWFRVPPDPPTLPVGAGEAVLHMRPAEGFLQYLKFLFWIALVLTDIALTVGALLITVALWAAGLWWLALLLLPVAAFVIVVPDLVAYVAIHLRYDTTWYVMTDRSIRIRRGIWVLHETTITFENVQNLKVQQGPLQRYFGIANLVLETAGSGGDAHASKRGGGVTNQGVIEGVADVHTLRDRILGRMRQSRTAGLGDEDVGRPAARAMWTPAHLAVLRDIRDHLRLFDA